MIAFEGTGIRLTDVDRAKASEFLGVDVATINAVILVESSGQGFGPANRPTILFEPHKFYQFVTPRGRATAIQQGLAYPVWGTKPYPKSQDARYTQLYAAQQIDETAALRATSWGLGQIMGFNHKNVGCPSVQDLVEESKKSEGVQLLLMARFIKALLLDKYLRARDWAGFARGYNGKNFAVNKYDEKLAAAYHDFRLGPAGMNA